MPNSCQQDNLGERRQGPYVVTHSMWKYTVRSGLRDGYSDVSFIGNESMQCELSHTSCCMLDATCCEAGSSVLGQYQCCVFLSVARPILGDVW
jgi:hypothetical protein